LKREDAYITILKYGRKHLHASLKVKDVKQYLKAAGYLKDKASNVVAQRGFNDSFVMVNGANADWDLDEADVRLSTDGYFKLLNYEMLNEAKRASWLSCGALAVAIVTLILTWHNRNESTVAEGSSSSVVTVTYSKPVKGFSIQALWVPSEIRNGYVLGPAIIKLTNEKSGASSTVTNNVFSIPLEKVAKDITKEQGQDGDSVLKVLNRSIPLGYSNPKISEEPYNFGTDQEPFFFYDINFDGRKDFILVEMFNGQRGGHTYKAYALSDSQNIEVLEDGYLQITNKEPFNLLDFSTTVDRKNKRIVINYSSGAKDSEQVVYNITSEGFRKD
jgi:hypothetical protein